MPIRVNPVPRPIPQHFGEASALRSPRDPEDLSRIHIRLDAMAKEQKWLAEAVKRQGDIINRLRLRRGGGDGAVSVCPYG